jgi:glyoxalase family protein
MSNPIQSVSGIHHVTAITSHAQKNMEFYCGVLGLRLVKLTVNYDDPSNYHLYYGDGLGRPGTILTFFAWPAAYRGSIGAPQVVTTSFSVPAQSFDFWSKRLRDSNCESVATVPDRFGDRILQFVDPDGMQLEFVGTNSPGGIPWQSEGIPIEHAIRGFHGVAIAEEGYEKTASVLTDGLKFKHIGTDQNRFRYQAQSNDGFASIVDVLCTPAGKPGDIGAGTVHHVAFRASDDGHQEQLHQAIRAAGYNVSPVMDRRYFRAIYFREPGGVLFEIATDSPGFTSDEPANSLGSKLMLPPWLEAKRPQIEKWLSPLKLPSTPAVAVHV